MKLPKAKTITVHPTPDPLPSTQTECSNISAAQNASVPTNSSSSIPNHGTLQASANLDLRLQNQLLEFGLAEHRFISLTQYSILRAFLQNANVLAIDPGLFSSDESLSPWTIFNPYMTLTTGQTHTLTPTPLQLRTLHHPFLDVLASPKLRDNILLAVLDDDQEEQLCYDLHDSGFTIWGNQPWNSMSWEVSQGFADRWGYILDDETIRFSNFWRLERGDTPLQLPSNTIQFIEDFTL